MEPDQMPKPPEGVTQIPEDMPPLPKDLLKVPKEGKLKNLLPKIIFGVFLIAALSAGGYFYLQNQLLKNELAELQSTPTPISSPQPTTETATPDPTVDWEMFNGKEFIFKYPPGWSAKESFDEYFGGEVIYINNPTKVVSIQITPTRQVYGFGGDQNIKVVQTPVIFTFNGNAYVATESTTENRTAFIDQEVDINGKKYFILFGTGYPVNDDEKASLTEYQKEKETILQILSTFEFSE